MSRQHFVQQHAQGINVDGGSNRIDSAAGLFGSHVRGRSQARAGVRNFGARIDQANEAEVSDFWRAVFGHENVDRLDVAMDETALVCELHCRCKRGDRSEEHTSELQSRGLISYAV